MKLNIVLLEPEIPQNTGSIARLSAATYTSLHLIKPLGFELSDRYLKRAGLDYWPFVELTVYENFDDFLLKRGLTTQEPPSDGIRTNDEHQACGGTLWFFSKKGSRSYTEATYSEGDYLVFGKETKGIPEAILSEYSQSVLIIPMDNPNVRSLNIANAASIALYEARRQIAERKRGSL